MAYNLQSLITILEQILNPEQTRWILDEHNKPQLQSLLQKALSLKQILQKSSHPNIESFESQIRDAAHRAEDLIESFMVDQMQSRPEGVSFTFLTPDLQQVMQQLDFVMQQVLKLTEEMPTSTCEEVDEDIDEAEDVIDSQTADQMLCGSVFKWLITCFNFSSSGGASSSRDPSSKRRPLVGVEKDLMQLKDRLTRTQKKLEIVPIVGMGGIGKTFLARNLYEDQLIVEHFDVRAWSTISQDYDMKAFLSDLGCEMGKKFDQYTELVNLRKRLYGRRYLIVLDDIWKIKFWDEVKMYFPENNTRSRIVITTRESDMAKYAGSQSQHRVQLLSKSDSRDLLHRIVFGEEENCPNFLRATSEKIAGDCGGLPLTINVIGGLLSKVERSKHAWENIADDVKAAISQSDNKNFSNLLSLSYNHLLNHLKPCFLYMGAFPEDYEVKASKLARLWVAEGFVEAKGDDKSLEEEAKEYLEDLVERNLLLLVKTETSNGKPKRYSIHDLLRVLCIEKAEEEKFLHAGSSAFSNPRRLSVHAKNGRGASAESSMPLARSFVSIGEEIMSPYFVGSRMMRVLDVKRNKFKKFPPEILQLFNLRYLGVSCSSTLPPGISRLWNLQTLIAKIGKGKVPLEIWELSELRHLKLNKSILFEDEQARRIVEKKMLQTISTVVLNPSLIRIGFFQSIPNVRDLRIKCDTLPSDPVDLTHLLQLQTLKFESRIGSAGRHSLPSLRFPSSIRKLTLIKCEIFVSVLTALSALPNMEMLKILNCVFKREETDAYEKWEVEEGDVFRSLKFLHLRHSMLVRWTADETNFPRLRRLFLESCYQLEEIPSGIGEIPTLELIDLKGCSDSAVESAKRIQEEQADYGNDDLNIRVV